MTLTPPPVATLERIRLARAVVAEVLDPELPVLTLEDLGVLRDVQLRDGVVEVTLTPTYSGCPAMEAMREDVVKALHGNGFAPVLVRTVLFPAWSTDWISAAGRDKLAQHGIAPPGRVGLTLSVRCPQCASPETREVSRFGATACKSLWSCLVCLEPFDHVKAL